jgi:hypothetical protein
VRLVDLAVRVAEESSSEEPGPATDVRALAAVVLEMAAGREDEPPAWLAEVAAIARGEAGLTAAQWAASLRAAAGQAQAAPPMFAPVQAPVVPPVVAPAVAAPVVEETGPEEHVPESMPPETGPEEKIAGVVEAPMEAVPEPEPARVDAAEPVAAEPIAAAEPERPTLEPVRPVSADEAWASAVRPRRSERTGLIVGVIAAVVLALIVWRLTSGGSETPPEPGPAPVEAPPRRSELPAEATTLARVAPTPEEAAPVEPPVEGQPEAPSESPPNEVVATAESPAGEQLTAAEFRKIMLRASRGQKARDCYDRHAAGDVDVEVVAQVGPRGKVQKLKIDEHALGECLRKLVLRLEFPRAARSAQHNFVFHRPDADG